MSDLMDDPTWDCDYKSRCRIPIIKEFIEDLEGCMGFWNTKEHAKTGVLKDVIKKWRERLKENEEDDK